MLENRQIAVIEAKCRRFRNSSQCLKTRRASNNWPIWTQKVPKEAQRLGLQTSIRAFSKIFSRKKFGQYIRMLPYSRSVAWTQLGTYLLFFFMKFRKANQAIKLKCVYILWKISFQLTTVAWVQGLTKFQSQFLHHGQEGWNTWDE